MSFLGIWASYLLDLNKTKEGWQQAMQERRWRCSHDDDGNEKVVRTRWYRKSYCLMDGSILNKKNTHFLFGWASTGLCELLLLVQTTQLRMMIHNSSTSISLWTAIRFILGVASYFFWFLLGILGRMMRRTDPLLFCIIDGSKLFKEVGVNLIRAAYELVVIIMHIFLMPSMKEASKQAS